jgi:4-aminobutyrate aminotransferase/(S)-3-amino-2-methylpropionate transaminase
MATIQIRTSIPGPLSKQWNARCGNAVAQGAAQMHPIFIAGAQGAVLEDVDGNRFIDFGGGIGCLNTGHRAPQVIASVRDQLDRYLHTCFTVTPYDGYIRLAEKLNAVTPGSFAKKTLLVNSGAEAIENAVKIARAYTRRPAVICFEDAFHGRTMLTLTLTSKTRPYKDGFGPFFADVHRVPYAYCYRCSYSLKHPSCGIYCAHHLEDTFQRVAAAETVAAIVVEPVLGEGGFVVPPKEFFTVLAEICRRHGILLIADEVQTGFGRTGALFACERYGLTPDMIVTAKSLGGGLPLAAVTGRAEIMDAPIPGALGGTFGGNPASCAAALAVIEMFEKGPNGSMSLAERANEIGDLFQARARQWKARFPLIGDVRGLGAMQAMELVRSLQTLEPAASETREVLARCLSKGLVAISAGTFGNVIRFLAPLVITNEQLDEGLNVLETALAEVSSARLSPVRAGSAH